MWKRLSIGVTSVRRRLSRRDRVKSFISPTTGYSGVTSRKGVPCSVWAVESEDRQTLLVKEGGIVWVTSGEGTATNGR